MSNQEEEGSIRMEDLGWSKVEIDSAAQESWEFGGFMGLEVLSASSYTIEKDASTGASVIKKKKKKKEKDEKERSKKNKKKKNKKHVEQEKKKGIATKAVKEAKVNISTPWRSTRLHQNLLVNAARQGFETPTPIQRAVCVKDVLSGSRDVVGTAETGSGKTLAFGLPVLHRLLVRKKNKRQSQEKRLQCLIVTPTRELALQIEKHLKEACLGSKIQIVSVVGGMAEQKQKRLLSRKPEIVVGTPGRLWAMIEDLETASYFRNLHELKFLVLDEVDRMFDRNAFPELKKILKRITEPRVVEDMTIDDEEEDGAEEEPKKKLMKSSNSYRQTFVMSATTAIPDRKNKKRKISADEKEYLNWIRKTLKLRKRPLVANVTKTKSILTIDASSSRKLPPGLDLRQIHCPSEDKDAHLYLFLFECLRNMTSLGESECRILVFANSIAHIKRLSLLLSLLQLPIHSLHAKMQQRQRLKNLDRFRNESCTILIATDVAARGLDIENIHYVVHYHLPNTVDTFVHRSGRTARARRVGMALSLVSPKEQKMYTRICADLELLNGMDAFPVSLEIMRQVHSRVSCAQKITNLQRKRSRETTDAAWLKKSAEEADLILDDELQDRLNEESEKGREASMQMKNMQNRLKSLLGSELRARHGLLTIFASLNKAQSEPTHFVPKEKKRKMMMKSLEDEKKSVEKEKSKKKKETKVEQQQPKQKKRKKAAFW